MTMMMQAFLSCRVNVAIELRCLYVFRLNYVKGKCCTYCTQACVMAYVVRMKICFSILFQFLLIFFCLHFLCVLLTFLCYIPNIFLCVPYFFVSYVTVTHKEFAPFLLFTSSYFVLFHSHYVHFHKTNITYIFKKSKACYCLGSCISTHISKVVRQ